MNELLIRKKKQMGRVCNVLVIFKYLTLLSIIIVLATLFYASFQSNSRFEAIHESQGWLITAHITNNITSPITISHFIMQFLQEDMINAKHAFLLYSFVQVMLRGLFTYCGTIILIRILKDIVSGNTPFRKKHINGIKMISIFIIIWFGLKDMILNILFDIFITKIFLINLSNIHLNGFLLGIVVYVIAEIFEYGKLLQEDVDMVV